MSYCRWSTDDYQCDVYVYEHVGGWWQIHVASNRRTPKEPFPPKVKFTDGGTEQEWKQWHDRANTVSDMLDSAERKRIGLSCDGANFQCGTPGQCAEVLKMLKDEGYNVPQDVIDILRKEQDKL